MSHFYMYVSFEDGENKTEADVSSWRCAAARLLKRNELCTSLTELIDINDTEAI